MANLGKIISEKIAADSQWREQRQMERDSITSTQGAGLVQITSDPASYARYLNMQADNFTYSPGNIALVMEQMPTATVFGTQERWQNLGRTVDPAELSKGASIFARSANGKGYAMTPAYDISQTVGRDIRTLQLADNSKEMEAALRILMNYSPVPVVPERGRHRPRRSGGQRGRGFHRVLPHRQCPADRPVRHRRPGHSEKASPGTGITPSLTERSAVFEADKTVATPIFE